MTTPASGRLIEDDRDIAALLSGVRRIAVLGIKTEAQANQPAFYVPEYLVEAGLDVVPVPVYYPEVTQILGRPVFRTLVDVPGPIDLVDVFRRSEDMMPHADEVLALPPERRPRVFWMQTGIRNDAAAAKLTAAGIQVVMDRCLGVYAARYRPET